MRTIEEELTQLIKKYGIQGELAEDAFVDDISQLIDQARLEAEWNGRAKENARIYRHKSEGKSLTLRQLLKRGAYITDQITELQNRLTKGESE